MLSDEVIEKVSERLVERIESLNLYILKKIAKTIKQIGTITPTQAYQLGQAIKFGGDYEKIVKKIAELTDLNVKDIKKLFEVVSKENLSFSKQFYEYRNKRFIPWEDNETLRNQVDAITAQMVGDYISNTRAIGYTITDDNGTTIFKDVSTLYQDMIDNAVLSLSQGKSTFEEEMAKAMQQIGSSGLKYVDYKAGTTRRLDSALRMNMFDTLNQLQIQNQLLFGQQFGADGVEITVVNNPAPDHAQVQGRQFTNEEFDNFQNDRDSVSVDGKEFPAVSAETKHDRRSIGQYNCRHLPFSIVIGVSKPKFTEEQLQDIIDKANEEFEFEGKKYNRYQGEQLQRKIETAIRKQKDIQIMGKESGIEKTTLKAQKKINQLTTKYYELSKASGLPTRLERLKVNEYRAVKLMGNSPLN